MNRAEVADARFRLTISMVFVALLITAVVVPYQFRSEAVSKPKVQRSLVQRTVSHEPGIENYDIREVKSEEVTEALMRFRSDAGKSQFTIATDVRPSSPGGPGEVENAGVRQGT